MMIISAIWIKRFMGIKDFYFPIASNITLIAGPNNAGKSTVLRALDYFFSGGHEGFPGIFYPKNKYYRDESNRALSSIRVYFENVSDSEKKELSRILKNDGTFWIELRATRAGLVSFNSSGEKSHAQDAYQWIVDNVDVIKVDAVRVSRDGSLREETSKLFSVTRDAVIRSRRGRLADKRKKLYEYFEKSIEALDDILEKGREFVSDAMPTKYEVGFEYPDSQDILEMILSSIKITTSGDMDITIDDEGTGHQSLLSLGVLKYVKEEAKGRLALFLIEEPEAFLHPHYQRAVCEYLHQLSHGGQVMATTHSSIIVDAFSIENVVRMPRSEEGLEFWKNPVVLSDKELAILNRYCDVKNSEIVFADKIILCEGLSDYYVIRNIVDAIVKDRGEVCNVSVLDCSGSAISHVSHLVSLFNIDSFVVIDRDYYAGDRATLGKIMTSSGQELSNNDYKVLDEASKKVVLSKADAYVRRNKVNEVLIKRGVYAFSSDIEGAIVASVSRGSLLRACKKYGNEIFPSSVVDSIPAESYSDYLPSVFKLAGSKGFNEIKTVKDGKPKPHQIALLAFEVLPHVQKDSDLYDIQEKLELFLFV